MQIDKVKARQMVRFKVEFFEDFSSSIPIKQNNKRYHYFEIYDGILRKTKVVNKESLREIYGYDCEDLFEFFRSGDDLIPQLLDESEHFFIFEYIEGDILTDIKIENFEYLKKFRNHEFYPFLNSLYSNIIRLKDGSIKLVDLKHLDFKICNYPEYLKKSLIVFLYNKENKVSKLYIEEDKYLDEILGILKKDYDNIQIIKV